MQINFTQALILHNQGLKISQIADSFGVSHQAVHSLFIKNKVIEKTGRKMGQVDCYSNKYPQKRCDWCGDLIQLNFSPLKHWELMIDLRCPKCQKLAYKPIVDKFY